MKKELQEKIINDFPELCSERELPSSFAFGFECGDGWYDLIYKLCKNISEISNKVKIMQVKEKFGELRFYINSGTDEIWKLIEKAEKDSLHICEECGKAGKLESINHWLKTICNECKK